MCAIWSPAVYLDENNKLHNLKKEIKRSKRLICSFCGFFGAGLGCCLI